MPLPHTITRTWANEAPGPFRCSVTGVIVQAARSVMTEQYEGIRCPECGGLHIYNRDNRAPITSSPPLLPGLTPA